jgi:tetratricopeptide (TPR) repeat protein
MPRALRLSARVAALLAVAAAAILAAGAGPRTAGDDLAPRLVAYARQRFRAGDFAAALRLRRRALALTLRDRGRASTPAAEAMAGLAALYIEMRRYLDAEPLLIVSRRDLLARDGPHDPALVPVLCALARIARARGAAAEARKWAAEAVALAARQGRQDPQYAAALRALGGALAAQKRFADAERMLRRALALDRARGGGNGPMVARDLAELGLAYLRQKRFAAALPLIERAAFLDQARLGPTHPIIADDYHELGLAYLGLGRPAEAAAALRFAIWVLVRGAGKDTARLAYTELTLARALHEEGHARKAGMLFNDAQKILGRAEKSEHRRERRA